ncbi:16S rRNA (adenine(1518)-N(6)/adenine(1519)-N(6))-dimethyltransferase RsmA [Cellulophaga sp. HaHaR_3_176]|uniref:16S rRNA (adenine(1518)-N(6)/adenine(1519)-N(6))- dimethyltransferase RsmA n=1 Tax=Cellulophaga sp. HaHaR_3_176 TaxID=1942464 RepID=UPI001C1F97C7|nr:16S rRNA (adenine(1518)-N(6)/adenine(1519)-N(6))-dimethyltransferase RsmA [Cellulophaga sp. HaHaR_3_176]QWX83948.1 16S rRNA (adenine(1518)-N(6)/adenine(1519)-N(6))-dimethyltransferase RsmA [Cellulophaga sp. HaHaR_3_176]
MAKKQFNSYNKNKSKKTFKEASPVKAKKYLGQHFLKDEDIARQIAETLTLKGYKNAIEIGPGTGVLTKYLLTQKLDLVAMDLDSESIIYLNDSFLLEHPQFIGRKNKFDVLEADFLKYDITTLFGDEQFAITGNFPYNISTQIVFKLLEIKELVPEFTGMFQKEVAKRICEKEGSKTYGILSVLVQAFYDAEYLFTVDPHVFNPPPKVDSGVLRLTRKENITIDCDEKALYKVVKAAFNQRRKTIRNSLKTFNLSDSLKEDTIFDKRPEQLSVTDFIALTNKIENDTI